MINALAPWFGSNRMLAEHVGRALKGCSWVGVPFAGGMCELPKIEARTIVVNDLHRHVMNLARVVKEDREALQERLAECVFHPDELEAAQQACLEREKGPLEEDAPLWWAADYFICSWMARSATAGTDGEFKAGLALRWEAGGGDSAKRFQNAAKELTTWQEVMRRCTFSTLDFFEWLKKVKDEVGHGVYADPPFPGPGDKYRHKFDEDSHRRMAVLLSRFERCRVVCRFYDHPLVRECYRADSGWEWRHLEGRKQSNNKAPEVLLVRNG